MVNANPETGIRYGVVSLNSLEDWVFDEFFQNGENLTANEAHKEAKAEFIEERRYAEGSLLTAEARAIEEWEERGEQEFWDSWECDEATYELETEGMKLGLSTLGGAYNVWVFESPHTAEHGLCSPCCPNAGNIDTPGSFQCYTLPAEWFDTTD
jgi:hypothetical protein